MNCCTNIARTMVPCALICLLICSSIVRAFPTIRSQASTEDFEHNDLLPRQMTIADGVLADYMFATSDFNHDNKMSSDEIASFYFNTVRYSLYVAYIYGERFIELADSDGDGGLNRNELITMLIALDAIEHTKR